MNNTSMPPTTQSQRFTPENRAKNPFLQPSVQQPKALVLSAGGAESIPDFWHKKLGKTIAVRHLKNLEPLAPESFVSLAYPYDYLAITRRSVQQIDRKMIESLPRLKGISVYSTGVEWIDTDCLRARNIRLASLPDYCTNAVAETALGLMFMAAHKLHLRYLKSIKTIPENVSLRGFELKSSTVGIIGFGKIGQLLAEKMQPLCAHVLVNDMDDSTLAPSIFGVRIASKEKIFATCDFIVFCAAQEYLHREIIAPETYPLLRPESVVINVGRTSLLNHDLLVKMVKQQRIRSYIYDDLMRENDLPNELEYGKIVPTGHTAWYTDEALVAGSNQWLKNLDNLCKIS